MKCVAVMDTCFLCEEPNGTQQLKFHLRKHQLESTFECPECAELWADFTEFLTHLSAVHSLDLNDNQPEETAVEGTEEDFICNYCNAKFTLKTELTSHLKTHIGFNCTRCEANLDTEEKLRSHNRLIHGLKPTCDECGKSFSYFQDLKRHFSAVHKGEKPYECPDCNKKFAHQTSLRHHKTTHTNDKPHICSYCGIGFGYPGNLSTHMRTHTGERPFKCKCCSKTFTRSATLNEHLKIHSNEKTHQCGVCDKRFRGSSALAKHKRIHLGVKNYACHICERSFLEVNHLKNHVMIHSDEKKYQCDDCKKYFRRMDTLRVHQRMHNRVKYLDLDTNLAFNSSSIILPINEDIQPPEEPPIPTFQLVPASDLDPTTIISYDLTDF